MRDVLGFFQDHIKQDDIEYGVYKEYSRVFSKLIVYLLQARVVVYSRFKLLRSSGAFFCVWPTCWSHSFLGPAVVSCDIAGLSYLSKRLSS